MSACQLFNRAMLTGAMLLAGSAISAPAAADPHNGISALTSVTQAKTNQANEDALKATPQPGTTTPPQAPPPKREKPAEGRAQEIRQAEAFRAELHGPTRLDQATVARLDSALAVIANPEATPEQLSGAEAELDGVIADQAPQAPAVVDKTKINQADTLASPVVKKLDDAHKAVIDKL